MRVQSLALLIKMRVQSLALLIKMGSIPGLTQWVRESHVAVNVVWAGSCSSDSTPSLGTSTYYRCSPKKKKEKRRKKKENILVPNKSMNLYTKGAFQNSPN